MKFISARHDSNLRLGGDAVEKKVGLVTLWHRNYGSALQCYATKRYIESLGFQCVPLHRTFTQSERYIYYIKELFRVGSYSLRYRGYLQNYNSMRNAGKKSIHSLSEESEKKIDSFVENVLRPEGYSYSDLKKLGDDVDYAAFVSGSDQIWSGARPYNPVMFLAFAPNKKKIALAPSFGSSQIAEYNRRKFGRAIAQYRYLSAREQIGVDLIADVANREAVLLPDPTALLTPKEWRIFSGSEDFRQGGYIFLHFLDKPSKVALASINKLKRESGLEVIAFAYPHEEYRTDLEVSFRDGDPRDYIKYIDNASYVITDSFHTTLFSIYFDTPFFTFHRQYSHGASQTSRVTNLLEIYGYSDRLIGDEAVFDSAVKQGMNDRCSVLEEERKKIESYLRTSIYEVLNS